MTAENAEVLALTAYFAGVASVIAAIAAPIILFGAIDWIKTRLQTHNQ